MSKRTYPTPAERARMVVGMYVTTLVPRDEIAHHITVAIEKAEADVAERLLPTQMDMRRIRGERDHYKRECSALTLQLKELHEQVRKYLSAQREEK